MDIFLLNKPKKITSDFFLKKHRAVWMKIFLHGIAGLPSKTGCHDVMQVQRVCYTVVLYT